MQFDIELIQEVYASYAEKVEKSRQLLGRPMTLTEKILYAHLYNNEYPHKPFIRGIDYVNFSPDRVAMQDATAQMALLQFMIAVVVGVLFVFMLLTKFSEKDILLKGVILTLALFIMTYWI